MTDLYVAKVDGKGVAVKTTAKAVEGLDTFVDEKVGGAGAGAVSAVNGKTGVVELTAKDVKALPDTTVIPTVPSVATATTDGLLSKEDKAKLDTLPVFTFEKVGEV